MGKGVSSGRAGAWLAIVVSLSMLAACGEVTAGGAEVSQSCAKKSCVGKNCPPSDQPKGEVDAGVACAAGSDGATGGTTGAGGQTGAGGAGANAPTEVAEFSCTVCRRAENCCKAEGLTDCGYTAACAAATNAQEMQFYVAQCRAVLSASTDGKRPRDACGF